VSSLLKHNIQMIKTHADFDDVFFHGFFEVYSDCFCYEPYFQRFSLERVKSDFNEMMLQGVFLCVRESNGRIAAFVAGSPLKNHNRILETALKVAKNQIDISDLNSYWYRSEIGVPKRLRRKGYARMLWNEILGLIPNSYTNILARTHKFNEDSLKMHERFGFTCISESEHIVEDENYDNPNHKPEDDTRVFLIRHCGDEGIRGDST